MPITDPDAERYAVEHTTPPDAHLLALAERTQAATTAPGMMVGALEGRFLELLVFGTGAEHVLEIGTFTGYSALSMAAGLPPGGRITTCEVDPDHAALATSAFDNSPFGDRIELREGPALDTIASLPGPFDLVFIDADKHNYRNYYEAVLPKLSGRGLILADNTLWGGRVMDGSDTSADTAGLREFNEHVRADPRVVAVLLPLRDGVTMIRRA